MTLLTIGEEGTRRVWSVPDTETVEWSFSRCVYADWITPELMRRTEEG